MKCWCYICDGRVPAGFDEEGGHAFQMLGDETAALPEETPDV